MSTYLVCRLFAEMWLLILLVYRLLKILSFFMKSIRLFFL
ncbi:Uncharacterised protein [Candidatus Bartonella washoeensis]|uniref:Uncharacterized protein n=1 Tax=Candidatus Bartonella washoeensis Sb944nv TaxID=1094563 RepID=J0YUK6_9HYPH|nr:hypothetical protein MCQ_01047 [Bartonella washoeensis Sb944nv]SPU27196.1 Uncharacterised protein [Bartonella washoeensis]